MKHIRRRYMWIALIGWAIALLFIGCATMGPGFEPPDVHLAGMRVVAVKGFETTFQIDLRVLNPNDLALPIEGIACDLTLNGRHLAKGVANPRTEIPAYGSAIVPVTVYASVIDMVGVAQRLIQGAQNNTPPEKWSYALKGHLDMGDATWSGKLPFDAKGEIDLKELTGDTPK
ncbi:MAG: LEA type 2 family protein [Desulfatitalea sp.]